MRHWLNILLLIFSPVFLYSQCPVAIDVNLTSSPTASFSNSYSTIGPLTTSSTCCPSSYVPGERCRKFSITLHPDAKGIRFEMNPGVSSGVFRINCGSNSYSVGSMVCLQGPGPHILTFCNPADVTALFKITSIPKATAGPDISISQGCTKKINAGGFDSTTVSWTSVTNNPTYNAYLSCTNCLKPTVTPGPAPPAFVDYKVCGNSVCGQICDTVRIFFTPPLTVNITPPNPVICNTQSPNSTTISATGNGGSGTYTYLWNNINSSQTITVPGGFYTVVVSDGAGCSASSIVEVKSFSSPPTAYAGQDKTVCKVNPTTMLNGTVTGAYGGIWSGGSGTFIPNNTTLNATYTPTSLELAAGFVDLTLTTTGNGSCNAASDAVHITFDNFTGVVAVTPTAVSCYGGNNGSAAVNVIGGSPPHTYSWNTVPPQTTSPATNLGLGTYTVTVTNSIGCTSTATAVITQPASIALASTLTPVTCAGGNNGAVSLITSGGTPPFTYLWQPGGQTTASINGKQAGSYTVTVTDSKGCPQQSEFTVVQPSPIAISFTATPASCYNGNDGKAVSSVSGGTPPYTFNWSSGATSPDASGLQAGTYTLTVTDNLGCTGFNTVVITQPPAFIANTTTVSESCNYANDGSATVSATGGNPGYTYQWQPGGLTSSSINNLASGTYTVIATDSKGCTSTGFANVQEPAQLAINFISQVNVSCFSGNDGFVTASPAGGTPPFTYLWTPGGATTASRNNLAAGSYSVTVTDSKGCTTTNNVVITEPSALLSISNVTVADVSCNAGNNGSISVTPAGGTAPYSYTWSPGTASTSTVSNLSAGTYTLTLKDSKGCQIVANYTTNEPAPIALSFAETPVSCNNGTNGTLTANVTGGNAPYTYSWMPGNGTTSTISNLSAGSYTLTLTDSKGCIATSTSSVTQPPPLSLNPVITNVVCSGEGSGSIVLAPSGGSTPYTYLWSLGGQTASSLNNLTIGTYSVTVTDGAGCQTTASYTITQLSLTIGLTPVHVSCFGGNNGSVSALPTGGTPNFTYSWAPGGATTNSITNLTAGTYTLSVTDSKGCVAQNTVTITQPAAVSVTAVATNKTCSNLNNGTVTANPSGGTPPFTYLWQPGLQTTVTISNLPIGTYTVTATDSKGCTASGSAVVGQPTPVIAGFTNQINVSTCYGASNGSVTASPSGGTPGYTYLWSPGGATTATLSNIAAGTYTLTVTDNAGCTATNSVTITQPAQINATTTKTNESCNYLNDGTASATASGGTSPYTFTWQPGNVTGSTITGLSAGTYSVTATDSKGCSVEKTAVITEPVTLTVNFSSQTNISCMGGTNGAAVTSVTGGTPNFSYLWSPGGSTTSNRTNLTAGTHSVTVTDSKGCIATNSLTLTEPPALSATSVSTNETCDYSNNGTATVTPAGGTPGYTYSWQPGLQTTAARTALKAGTYTVTVKDTKGCATNVLVTITEPPALTVNFTAQTNVSCFGGNNGTVTASPSGGTPGYTYVWSPGGATTATRTNLTAGTYSVTVKDSKGCAVTKTVAITQPTVLLLSASRINETCNYLNNGTATASPSGGTAPYSYSWSPGGQTTKTITGLASGTYTVFVTDAKGCAANRAVSITEPAALTVTFGTPNNVSCYGGNDGAVAATVTGGTMNYSYSWAPGGQTTNARYNLTAGTYSITVTDYYGCTATNNVTITQPSLFTVTGNSTSVSCNGIKDGTLSSSSSGGTSPYTYKWQAGGYTTQNVNLVTAGTYTITSTDAKGCIAKDTVIVVEPDSVLLSAITTPSGCNLATGTANISASGGFSPYTYLWSTGSTNTALTSLASGSYTVAVTDSHACVSNHEVNINDDSVPTLTMMPTHVGCYGDSTGLATVIPVGGYGTFSYLWTPMGGTAATATGLPAGIYTVKVQSSPSGCKTFGTVKITEPGQLSASVTKTNVSCFGGSDGTATASGISGTPPYSYAWSPGGGTSATITNLPANTYTVQVTDFNNCSVIENITITQPVTPISFSLSSTPASCFGTASGTLSSTTASGGAGGPYSYTWTPGNYNGQSFIRLPAATYTLTVKDAKGCIQTDTTTVGQPPLLTASFINQLNVSCFGQNTGAVTVSAAGGVPGYTYFWIPGGATTATISNLPAGVDSVTVIDFNGCVSGNKVTITQPTELNVSITKTNETCDYLNDGTATSLVSGATPPYTYSWVPGGFTSGAINNLAEDTYTLVVTDALGCNKQETAAITEPALLGITYSSQTDVSCFGGTDGIVTATASGGTPGYDYSWAPGGVTSATLSNIGIGTYTLTLTDANNCIAQSPVTVTQPAAAVSATLTSTPASCFGGSDGTVSASASGGTAPYNYNWTPGNYNGESLSNLAAGSYTVTITDSKGCIYIDSITVSQPTAIAIATTTVNSNCGQSNGQAMAVVSGGTLPYSYEWTPVNISNDTATGLMAGSYTITVVDSNACEQIMTAVVADNNGPVGTVSSTTNIDCYGASNGSVAVTMTSGSAPFTYVWQPSGGTDSIATGLAPGTYTVTVTDSNLCQSQPIISPEITEASPIYIQLNMNPVSCFGGSNGSATANGLGGTPPYNYTWLPGGTTGTSVTNLLAGSYTVQVTDFNNCQQILPFTITEPSAPVSITLSSKPVVCFGESNGEITAIANGGTFPYNFSWMPGNLNGQNLYNLSAGTYTVTTSDSKGCSIIDSIEVTQPNILALVSSGINSNCSLPNGQASVAASGGTMPYTYLWAPASGTDSLITGLLAGTYSVTVTDTNACSASETIIINDNPSPVVTVSSVTNVSCNAGSDGSITVSVTGAAGPFTYSWLPSGGTAATANGLIAGTYTVTVTDTNNCQSTPSTNPVITEPTAISVNVTTSAISCFGQSNVNASATAVGGTPGYSYLWLPAGTTGSSISNLSANTYTIQVTDSNNCIQTSPFTITEPTQLTATISASVNVSCFGGNDGTATVTAGGGTPVYSYDWQPSGGNGTTEQGLVAGSYTVTITDFSGCTAIDSITITEPAQALSASSTMTAVSCFGAADGSATISGIGGTPGFTFIWSPSVSTTNTAIGLSPGIYTVLVSDSKGCQANVAVNMTEPTALSGTLSSVNPSCGTPNGSIVAQVSGGTAPYLYLWSTGATSSSITGLWTGSYSVQITDANNCSITLYDTLVIAPDPIAAIASVDSVSCYGGNDGHATVAISAGTAPFTITWFPAGGNSLISDSLPAGVYSVTVTDALGCQSSDTATVFEPAPIDVTVASVTDVLCNGQNSGTATINVTGGTGTNYTYAWLPSGSTLAAATALSAGSHTVTVRDINNCPAAVSVAIAEPTVLTSLIDSVSHPVCFGGSGRASAFVSGGVPPYQYGWLPAGDSGSIANNISAGTYTVNITDANGCVTSSSVTITQPSQIITTAGPDDTLCVGQSATIAASATGGAGNYIYAWQPSSAVTGGTLNISPVGDVTYSVVAYDQLGCSGTTDMITAVVYTLDSTSLEAFATSPVCPGQASVVYAETYGNTGVLTYQWSNGLGNQEGVYTVTPTQPSQYVVTITNACASVSDTAYVAINPPPALSFTSDTTALCVPGTIQFTDNSVTGNPDDPITTWTWNFGDGSSSSEQNPAHLYTAALSYPVTLTVTTSGGCTNNNLSAPITINGNPYPTAAFNLNGINLNLPYDVLTTTNQSTGAATYLWTFGDGQSSTLSEPQHLYTSLGSFQVQLIAISDQGCMDTAYSYSEVTTDADVVFPSGFTPSMDGSSGGSYDPNSLENNVFFPYTSGVIEYRLEIYNRWGQVIFVSEDVNVGWDGYFNGKLCQQDVYIWKAFVKLNNGKTFEKNGNLTLLH
ncbi:MAG: PKD domain-containing protein [Bacteroidia bacterium]